MQINPKRIKLFCLIKNNKTPLQKYFVINKKKEELGVYTSGAVIPKIL